MPLWQVKAHLAMLELELANDEATPACEDGDDDEDDDSRDEADHTEHLGYACRARASAPAKATFGAATHRERPTQSAPS